MPQVSTVVVIDDVESAVVSLLDISVLSHHDHESDETFLHCEMCDEWDGHKPQCAVPALERWLDARST